MVAGAAARCDGGACSDDAATTGPLVAPSDIPNLGTAALSVFASRDVAVVGDTLSLRRLDVAADVETSDAQAQAALLTAFETVLPRRVPRSYGNGNVAQVTVGDAPRLRAYDWSAWHDQPGWIARLESQHRFSGSARLPWDAVTDAMAARLLARELGFLIHAGTDMMVLGRSAARARLVDLHADGRLASRALSTRLGWLEADRVSARHRRELAHSALSSMRAPRTSPTRSGRRSA